MSEAGQYLRQVKTEFENRGVRNEVQITEHVAFLLLPEVRERWDELKSVSGHALEVLLEGMHNFLQAKYVGLRIPLQPPVRQWGLEPLDITITALENAFPASPHKASWGDFFQREVRSVLLRGASGTQYPTPHHIAEFMAVLALSGQDFANILDPTAGSGGLLAAALPHQSGSWLTARDLDPQWAGIGSANLLLHSAENATYDVGSALGLANVDAYAGDFSAIIMNPPFGGNRSTAEIESTVGLDFGRSNATVLIALALRCLKAGGRAAVLAPSGVLFGGGGEANLRRELLANNLEAVVHLPKDAFQPYSQVGGNLLVLQKRTDGADRPDAPVWFLMPDGDGYDPGMGRDLTGPQKREINGLPRVRDLVLQTREGAWATRLTLPGAIIQTVRQQDDTGLVGVAVRAIDSPDRINWSTAFPSGGLFAKLRNEANGFVGWLYEPFVDGASYAFPAIAGDTPAQQWPDLIPAADWAEHIAPDWQGEEDEITLSVSAGTGFTLNKYDFRVHLEAAIQACLLNGEYRPLTPWCGCTDPKLVDALDEEPDKNKFKALPLQDGMNERCGWLVELTAASEIDNDDTVQATLLLTAGRQVKPFTQEERRFLILNTGWLVIDAGADSQIEIHSGQTVRLSDNVRLDGIAVGPGLHDQSHHLFGLWVPRSEFVDPESGKVGDLRTTRFFPEPEAALLDTPADLLVNIRRNQNSLVERVDILLRSLSLQTEPDFTAADIPPWIVHMLGHDQRALWTLIDRHRSEGRPSHFTREHLLQWCKESELEHCQEDDIERQLELLLSLGLIQRVHVKGDEREGDYYENLFRAVTRGDVMQEVTE